jgi:hypothetical protein
MQWENKDIIHLNGKIRGYQQKHLEVVGHQLI